jgi:small subunit ribosomal protein S16
MQDPAAVTIDTEKLNHWIGQGAEPTVTVRSLIKKHGNAPPESV